MKTKLTLLLSLFLLSSCKTDPNKHIDEGKITNDSYHSTEIGWTMNIPKGWTITHKSDLEARTQKGLDAINETAGTNHDIQELKQLLNFQKNRFNLFQSTSEPFELEYPGEWEENDAALKELVYNTYLQKGIKADSSATEIVKVDGLDFRSYEFTIYGPKGDVILHQLMFSRLINGLDFGVNINYNNEADKKEMVEAWLKSKFKR